MSERMTDDEFAEAEAAGGRDADTSHEAACNRADVCRTEANRARRVEQEQAEVIKALADALEWLRAEVDMGLITKGTAKAVDAAIRLAGRSP